MPSSASIIKIIFDPKCNITLADFAPGSGTLADPYTIRYATQLDLLATRVNSGVKGLYIHGGRKVVIK